MKILFLSTWFPYPPNQGSKIRAYYLLKHLAQAHEVALVTYEDVDLDPAWVEHIQQLCSRLEIVPRKPFAASAGKTWLGWLSPRPSAVVAIHSMEMAEQVKQVAQSWRPDCVVALTFVTAPYALDVPGVPKVLDIDNFMARMLQEAIPLAQHPLGRFRRWLAYRKFLAYERKLYPQFDLCLAVTESDRLQVMQQMSLQPGQVIVVPNGVDTRYNQVKGIEPVPDSLIFNGALTYNANFDAMAYFLAEIFPLIRQQAPQVRLRVTGSTQGVDLSSLNLNRQVELTGYLADIRPAVAKSWACVVPLRLGGGTRLKILEAMSLGTPVISTAKGAEGLEVENGVHLLIADSPGEFAEQVLRLLRSAELREDLAHNAARLVSEKYEWSQIGAGFRQAVEGLVLRKNIQKVSYNNIEGRSLDVG
jgi:glycosyltransferase involved in cell wall biosynthesis